MNNEALRVAVLILLVVEHAYVGVLKTVMVALMSRTSEKHPLDRALLSNMAALAVRMFLLATVMAASIAPDWSDRHILAVLIALSVSGAWVAWSVTWVFRELWKERLSFEWEAWLKERRTPRVPRPDEEARSIAQDARGAQQSARGERQDARGVEQDRRGEALGGREERVTEREAGRPTDGGGG
ncbi:MAG: hypothetical protein M3Q10_02920 [Chloroflexota bacterium]|nr:hypothetical protein [Chloroflexota bacterium]